jgi:tetratricopeptide (TPR) repeat protein
VRRLEWALRGFALLVAAAALAACADLAASRARSKAEGGDLPGAQADLERQREAHPGSVDTRIALGRVYYQIARDALDRQHDEARYLAYLERSVGEFVSAIELDPRNDQPHFYLAMIDAYRGDLPRTLRGLNNVRHLEPSGTAYTNIAEVYVYMGQLQKARTWNDIGLRKGAPYDIGVFNDMLIAWKQGDLQEARHCFADLRASNSESLRTINEARLPEAPRRFEDFAGYCCGSPACGPYMRDACHALELDVRDREVSKEAVLEELRIEMEKQRRLRQVYEQHKELEIDVEDGATKDAPR